MIERIGITKEEAYDMSVGRSNDLSTIESMFMLNSFNGKSEAWHREVSQLGGRLMDLLDGVRLEADYVYRGHLLHHTIRPYKAFDAGFGLIPTIIEASKQAAKDLAEEELTEAQRKELAELASLDE